MSFELSIGRKNNRPQIPPQTMRGYSHAADNDGAIETEKCLVIPTSPNNQTVRLFANAPKQPAAKYMSSFFIEQIPCLNLNSPLLVVAQWKSRFNGVSGIGILAFRL